MQNKRPRHQESAQPIRNEIMNRPQNPELHQKQALSLHRAYILVGVVGAVMLVFILNNYLNSKRLNELTSPLWTAIREVELEATAVQHEATDLLRGEIEPAALCILFKNKKLYTYWLCCRDTHFVLCGDFGLNDENLRKKQDIQQRDVSINQVVRLSLNAMLTSRV
jgi:hypothetical protein